MKPTSPASQAAIFSTEAHGDELAGRCVQGVEHGDRVVSLFLRRDDCRAG